MWQSQGCVQTTQQISGTNKKLRQAGCSGPSLHMQSSETLRHLMNRHRASWKLKGTLKKHWATTNLGTSHKITSQCSLQCQDKVLLQTEKAKEAWRCNQRGIPSQNRKEAQHNLEWHLWSISSRAPAWTSWFGSLSLVLMVEVFEGVGSSPGRGTSVN